MAHVITVAGVWKRFRLRPRTLRELAADLWRKGRGERGGRPGKGHGRLDDLWAVQDVSLDVAPGTTLALVGANGSGKSTLLKVIAGMMPPTRGSIAVSGRLAYLGYLAAGFHGDLTGRENVALDRKSVV